MTNPNLTPIECETWLVDRKPMKIEFVGKWSAVCGMEWRTRICSPFTPKSHWLANIQWKSIFLNIDFSCRFSYGEFEYELQSYLHHIGRLTTNRNRGFEKHIPQGQLVPKARITYFKLQVSVFWGQICSSFFSYEDCVSSELLRKDFDCNMWSCRDWTVVICRLGVRWTRRFERLREHSSTDR